MPEIAPSTTPEYQVFARAVHFAFANLVGTIHDAECGVDGLDGAPIIAGALTAVVEYASHCDKSDADLKAMLVKMIDDMLPQIRADGRLGKTQGRA